MDKITMVILAIGIVLVGGILYFNPNKVEQTPPEQGPIILGSLVQGAMCEQDSDCTYALNVYPTLKCVSPNCPEPNDPNQPDIGDPNYEWIEGNDPACVNTADLQGNNLNGEPLQIDTREASCACKPIESENGIITSVTGEKVCVVV
jgi:hypothetical protein